MPRFFLPAAQITDSRALLTGPEFHHLRHVLRLTTGDGITLCDEAGAQYEGIIVHCSATNAEVAITEFSPPLAPRFTLTLAQAVLKPQKMDLVIEKATELGVNRVSPFFSTFTVVHMTPEHRTERVARWQRLARSAAKQSGSPAPAIDMPCSLPDLLATHPEESAKILLYEKEQGLSLRHFAQSHPSLSSLWVAIGPEKGFAAEEIAQARDSGVHIIATALCRFLWDGDRFPLPSP
jgi:16S rRNA (uracil1498-N3)-methyltransferase